MAPSETWKSYWADVEPRLAALIEKLQNPLALKYCRNVLALYSFVTEDIDKKVKAHSELHPKLSVFLIEIQDLMRGINACFREVTLAPLALQLRTAFEIHCNFKFIVRSTEPAKFADRFDRFQAIEQLLGLRSSPHLPTPTDDEIRQIAKVNPEWFESDSLNLIENAPHWTAIKGMNLRKVAESVHVGLIDDYLLVYKTTSKFTHASPIVRNLYRKLNRLQAIPTIDQAIELAFLSHQYCIKTLQEHCAFFGVGFPEYDYALIAQDMIEAMGGKRLDPKDFTEA